MRLRFLFVISDRTVNAGEFTAVINDCLLAKRGKSVPIGDAIKSVRGYLLLPRILDVRTRVHQMKLHLMRT